MHILKKTRSICPECFKILEANIFEEDNKVYIRKECKEHGIFEDVYWSDVHEYKRAQKYAVIGEGVSNPTQETNLGHPFDCGLCPNHKSGIDLAIIDVTNRCNLRCPICFANAAVAGYVYEPTVEQIRKMLKTLKDVKPIPPNAIQFSGGEPTIREDLPKLIRIAKEVGFDHVEVNSNGLKLAESLDYCKSLFEADVSTIYLQFDGVTPDVYLKTRGCDLFSIKLKAIENCRKAGFKSIVLVPTVVKGVNDHQLGDIIRFAAENFDIIRCVNFQPVSITGRIDYGKRREMRITLPDCMKLVEKQTEGQVKVSDFYPVPVVFPVSRAVSALKGERYPEFTVHEHCGVATFLLVDKDKLTPITHYVDVDKFLTSLDSVYKKASEGHKRLAQVQLLSSSLRTVNLGLLKQLLGSVFKDASYDSLGNFMSKILMIGMMHFQDPYNFDLERVERCGICYAVPDGRIIPFCAMNTLHRKKIEKDFSVSKKN